MERGRKKRTSRKREYREEIWRGVCKKKAKKRKGRYGRENRKRKKMIRGEEEDEKEIEMLLENVEDRGK